jgi:hypothetical protein
VTLDRLDAAAVARALALVAPGADDLAELFFECRSEAELPPNEAHLGFRLRREAGLAARFVRGEQSWSASRDGLAARDIADVLRAVARVLPPTLPELPELAGSLEEWSAEPPFAEMAAFAGRLERALRRRWIGFPMRLTVRWHERDVRIVGERTASAVDRERFGSVDVVLPWGRCGLLAPALDESAAETLAERLAGRFRAREAPPPPAGHPPLLLSPEATAVALHEGIAHALEADLLAQTGSPDAAAGQRLGGDALSVLDDPAAAPPGVARSVDDEGVPVVRRWLVRDGCVAQPIADRAWARRYGELLPGSGFRADRHALPLPRSHHLELLAGSASDEQLAALAEGGLAIGEISAGSLDPTTGEVTLEIPGARRLRGGAADETVGPFRVRGRVATLLGGVVAVGGRRVAAGAGWCAKGGQRKAVWATVPALVVAGLEVVP